MHRQGYDLQLTRYDDKGWRYVLHDRHGALAHERDGHRLGAHAVARDAAGGVGRVGKRGRAIVMSSPQQIVQEVSQLIDKIQTLLSSGRRLARVGAVSLLVPVLAGGCAPVWWASGELPLATPVPQARGDKPSLVVRVVRDTVGTGDWQVDFRELVEEVTEQSNLFSRVAINPREGDVADYTVELNLELPQAPRSVLTAVVERLYAALIIGTFGAIPIINTEHLEMTVHVFGRTGMELKKYVLRDSMTSVGHPLVLLVYWFAPGPDAVASNIVENMLRTLYQRALNDGLLRQH